MFSHLGVTVPDVQATEGRMGEYGVIVLKGVGEALDLESVKGQKVAMAFGLANAGVQARAAVMHGMGWIWS